MLLALWSIALSVPAFLAAGLVGMIRQRVDPQARGFRALVLTFLTQVLLGVGVTTIAISTFMVIWSDGLVYDRRGGIAGVTLRMMLAAGLLLLYVDVRYRRWLHITYSTSVPV